MLDDLAEGAGQLCAQAALDLDIPLIVALPLPRTEFEKDFEGPALEAFRSLLERAKQQFVVPAAEAAPDAPDRNFFYRQQGIYVATHCQVLLALWDGGEGTPGGCGTAEAVSFALQRDYRPRDDGPLLSVVRVIQLFTPRGERCDGAPGTPILLGDGDAWTGIMDRQEEFNRLCDRCSSGATLLPKDQAADGLLDRMEELYGAADGLSLRFARAYRRVLGILAGVSTLITVAFLLYDEANWHFLILACGLALVCAFFLQRYAKKSQCHRRYLEYRALAESLRVQAYLRYAGVKREGVSLLPWSQQYDIPWVAMAMLVLGIGPQPDQSHDIRDCWPGEQLRYHRSMQQQARGKLRLSERVVWSAMLISVGLYVAALAFELFFGGMLPRFPAILSAEVYRTALKLALGSISAATLFISNYYGKLSLSRVLKDHEKMAAFYERIDRQLTRCGQTESLLLLLAREELIENGNWCSYQQDNTPDFSL